MEAVDADALSGKLRERGRVGKAAKGIRHAKVSVVNRHDEYVRRVLWQMIRLDSSLTDQFLQRWSRCTGRRCRRKWKYRALLLRKGDESIAKEAQSGEKCE